MFSNTWDFFSIIVLTDLIVLVEDEMQITV